MGALGGTMTMTLAPCKPLVTTFNDFEIRMLKLIADGRNNEEIRDDMKSFGLGQKTTFFVQKRIRLMMDQVGASNRAGLVAFAIRRGIIK